MFRPRIAVLLSVLLLSWLLHAQTVAPPPAAPSTPAKATTTPQAPVSSAAKTTPATPVPDPSDGPQVLVSASENSFLYHLTLDTPNAPAATDIRASPLTSTDRPGIKQVLALTADPTTHTGNIWDIPIHLSGMIPFGTSTVTIYQSTKKLQTITVLKTGLAIQAPPEILSQGDPLLLVVQNPTEIPYASVRARLRFKGRDICSFSVEQFPGERAAQPPVRAARPNVFERIGQWFSSSSAPADPCENVDAWTSFTIPRYSGVSLRADQLPKSWFSTNGGSANAVPAKGSLTLRFSTDPAHPQLLEEQVLPLEVGFQPNDLTRGVAYARVFTFLVLGALGSLLLRVVIPNARRLRSIRDQLGELRKVTRGISEEVDSMLRVQLRVENLGLATLSSSVWPISPSFAETAQRTEVAIATLRRRIDYVRRLDAALSHRRLLITDELAQPTRIAAIDRSLNIATEELKSDQFRDQDWVFIQQALEAADKVLGSPTEEDKTTFETVLVQRWKSLASQYGFDANHGWLNIPDSLKRMEVCFPSEEVLCPRPNPLRGQPEPVLGKDYDINQWIKAAGSVRADLQISALELIREVQFLAPSATDQRWQAAMDKLIPWLATPAFENLVGARLLLRELSETITPDDIAKALQNREAAIEIDPQTVGIGERVHLAIRFRLANWNSAASRREILCEWRFKAEKGKRQSGVAVVRPKASDAMDQPAPADSGDHDPDTIFFREKGWEVYHFFERDQGRSPLEIRFYLRGRLLMDLADPTKPLIYPFVFDLQKPDARKLAFEQAKRALFESFELFAALLVPLCALVVTSSSSSWWQLVGLGFGSDTIRNVLSGASDHKTPKQP